MAPIVLTGRQVAQLANLVDGDEDEVAISFQRRNEGAGLYACSARAGLRPLFDLAPELPPHAIQPVSQPRR